MSKSKYVEVCFGNHKIDEQESDRFATARPQIQILVCPRCLKDINFGRWNENEEWEFRSDDTFASSELDIRSKSEYFEHIDNCPSYFNDGINKVDYASNSQCFKIIERLAKWSRRATRWDTQQVCETDFITDDRPVIAYVYKDEVGPISYVAYREFPIPLDGKDTLAMCCWDIFTFSEFRRRGYATQLLEYSLDDLKIDRSLLPLSYPVTKDSCEIIKRIAKDKLLLIVPERGYEIIA
jgi:GNAT superfamily N-acetyltransferase